MLILDRRLGEWIDSNVGISIQIVRLNARRVKLGFVLPDDVRVVRRELGPPEYLTCGPAANTEGKTPWDDTSPGDTPTPRSSG